MTMNIYDLVDNSTRLTSCLHRCKSSSHLCVLDGSIIITGATNISHYCPPPHAVCVTLC